MKTSLRVRRPGLGALVLSLVLGAPWCAAPALALGATPAESPRPETAQAATQPAATHATGAAPATQAQDPQGGMAAGAQKPAAAAPQSPAGQDEAIVIRNDAPGYNGYAGTWRDPETGDIVTSVIAPRRPQEQAQQPPIYIAPQIEPDWPAGGYGTQGWNTGNWNGAPGWNGGGNGWNGAPPPGWTPGPPPGGPNGWNGGAGQGWRPQRPGRPLPGPQQPGPQLLGPQLPGMTPPAMTTPGQTAAPPSPQPGVRPPQTADRPGPGGLPLPGMEQGMGPGIQPGMQPPQGAPTPPQPAPVQAPNWQGTPPNWQPGASQNPGWRPSGWDPQDQQPQGWQRPTWQQSAWQQSAWQQPAWQPWAQAPSPAGIKSWTPGQPPHGDWQPLSWSPGPAGAWNPQSWRPQNWQAGASSPAWDPWRPVAPGALGMGAPYLRPGMYPGMRARFLGQPLLPPNITRHLGPVVPLSQRGGPR